MSDDSIVVFLAPGVRLTLEHVADAELRIELEAWSGDYYDPVPAALTVEDAIGLADALHALAVRIAPGVVARLRSSADAATDGESFNNPPGINRADMLRQRADDIERRVASLRGST